MPGREVEHRWTDRIGKAIPTLNVGPGGVFENWLQLMLALGVVAVLVASAFSLWNQYAIREFQAAGRDRAYQSRAVGCRTILLLGAHFDEGDPCLLPEVRRFYDVDETPILTTEESQRRAAAAVNATTCELAERLGHALDSC